MQIETARLRILYKAFHHSSFISYLPAELGDCDPAEHLLDLVSEFRFIPNQTEDMEVAIFNAWKECRYKWKSLFYKKL